MFLSKLRGFYTLHQMKSQSESRLILVQLVVPLCQQSHRQQCMMGNKPVCRGWTAAAGLNSTMGELFPTGRTRMSMKVKQLHINSQRCLVLIWSWLIRHIQWLSWFIVKLKSNRDEVMMKTHTVAATEIPHRDQWNVRCFRTPWTCRRTRCGCCVPMTTRRSGSWSVTRWVLLTKLSASTTDSTN